MAVLIVGNKCDAEGRQISLEEAKRFASEANCAFMEVSASTGIRIKESLAFLIGELTIKRKEGALTSPPFPPLNEGLIGFSLGWLWKVPNNATSITKWERVLATSPHPHLPPPPHKIQHTAHTLHCTTHNTQLAVKLCTDSFFLAEMGDIDTRGDEILQEQESLGDEEGAKRGGSEIC